MGNLAVACKAVVDINIMTGIRAFQVQEKPFLSRFLHPEAAAVAAAGIFLGDIRGQIRNGVINIHILMAVISVKLPVGRHRNPFCPFLPPRSVFRGSIIPEIPHSVQQNNPVVIFLLRCRRSRAGRDIKGSVRHGIYADRIQILMIILLHSCFPFRRF